MRLFLIIGLLPFLAQAQIGGQFGYQALSSTTNPRAAALSGSVISLADGDISQFFENPATLDSVQSGSVFFHVNPYFADVTNYSLAYSFDARKAGDFTLGIHYLNFGSFVLTDPTGQELGSFSARDYVISLGKAHQLGPFSLGANIKLVNSAIDIYSATAIAADLSGIFRISKNWTVGMVFQNIGTTISTSELDAPIMPFDVVIGTSLKPEYMPLRFSITSSNLVNRNLTSEQEDTGRSVSALDDVLKRINFGAELLLSQNFQLLFGYNHKRKQELRLETLGGGAGFSYGLMVKVKRIQLRFSRATFHAAGGSSFISLQTNLKDFKKIL